jgi:hypothetical protein
MTHVSSNVDVCTNRSQNTIKLSPGICEKSPDALLQREALHGAFSVFQSVGLYRMCSDHHRPSRPYHPTVWINFYLFMHRTDKLTEQPCVLQRKGNGTFVCFKYAFVIGHNRDSAKKHVALLNVHGCLHSGKTKRFRITLGLQYKFP